MIDAPNEKQVAFVIKDCAMIVRMAGVDSAFNLRELRERLRVCPIESLFHHFCETAIRASFDDPEFRNDFAVWASRTLRDRVLAERLGILTPYGFENMEALRARVIEIIDERLAEVHFIPWAPRGEDFHFMQAATVTFTTAARLESVEDFLGRLPILSVSSIYYHFVEARRRTPDRHDDFTRWLERLNPRPESLIKALRGIDFYFLNLRELKERLIEIGKEGAACSDR